MKYKYNHVDRAVVLKLTRKVGRSVNKDLFWMRNNLISDPLQITKGDYRKAQISILNFLQSMLGLSDKGISNRYTSNPLFRQGVETLIQIWLERKKGW